jgi:hypothetical protein
MASEVAEVQPVFGSALKTEVGSLPGMIWEAIVANYDYGGEEGLKDARAKGQAFSEFTTEQQGDILQDCYIRLKGHLDVSTYEPWVNDVKAGRENDHHYPTVEPLPAATFDVWKLNGESRDRQEAELVAELRQSLRPNDPCAVARANRLLEFFRSTLWSAHYRERIIGRDAGDELVRLLYLRLSPATLQRIFALLHVETAPPNR